MVLERGITSAKASRTVYSVLFFVVVLHRFGADGLD